MLTKHEEKLHCGTNYQNYGRSPVIIHCVAQKNYESEENCGKKRTHHLLPDFVITQEHLLLGRDMQWPICRSQPLSQGAADMGCESKTSLTHSLIANPVSLIRPCNRHFGLINKLKKSIIDAKTRRSMWSRRQSILKNRYKTKAYRCIDNISI